MDAPTPAGMAIGLAVCFAAFRALELLHPRSRRTPLPRKGLATDVAYWFLTPLLAHYVVRVAAIIAVVPLLLVVHGTLDPRTIEAGFGPLARLPFWAQLALTIVVADLIGYWTHRLFHSHDRLWSFHAVHHSARVLDWLSAMRVHPVSEAVSRIFMVLPMIALGLPPLVAVAVGPFFAIYGLLLHANLDWDWGPLRAVVASPRFHRWHHSDAPEAQGCNLAAVLPLWDILFGTWYMPRDRVPESFGTATPLPDGIVDQLLYPFRRSHSA